MKKRQLMYGNHAIAEAAVRAGCQAYFGYPITPQNELIEYMSEAMPRLGRTFIQAESEIGAINMVYGAAAAGGRVMTSSSSPGISLKQEGISYMVGAELPGVIVNIVRGGPGLGNIAAAQSDYYQSTRGGGHGDYRTIVLAPYSVQEAVNLTIKCFDLADKYRNPVMLVGDGLMGQMKEPVSFPPYKDIAKLPAKGFAVGINKGRSQRRITSIYLEEGALEELNLKLAKKYRLIEKNEVRFEEDGCKGADLVIVAYGTCARVVKGALIMARKLGLKVGLIRPITLWPFPKERLGQIAGSCKKFLTVEMSLGQMFDDVNLAVGSVVESRLLARTGGGIQTSEDVLDEIKKILKASKKPRKKARKK